MKNICFLNGDMSRSGGTERVTAIIANELSKIDEFNVHILSTSNSSNTSFFELNEGVSHNRILADENINFKKQYVNVVKGIRKYIKVNDIDVLIDVDVICDLFSIPATRFTKTKLISWEHFHFYENNGSRLRSIARKLSEKYSDYIITLTEKDKSNYIENLNVSNKIECIYNPITKVNEDSCDIYAKQILSVGRLTYQKGFDMLCEVANKVLNDNPDWKWVILGEGEDRALIESKIKEYKLEGRLIIEGNVSNVDDYYKSSSLFVMTSRFEGLPMTLLEAKSYGLPIVSFDCLTGPSDIVTDDKNGYLVELGDINKMYKQINGLINNEKLLNTFKDNSKIDIGKFELKSVLYKWIELLKEV